MSNSISPTAPTVLRDYYRILTAGPDAFGNGDGLRGLLSEHLDFTGSLAGHIPDATNGFLRGVADFISTVRGITILREVHDENGSGILYDAELPGGTVRFAEFFTFEGGAIGSLDLHYDGPDYLAKGGR